MQEASPLDNLTRTTASLLITGYQKYLSPHKGFACAHRIWHRGESCSQYTKRTILEQGLVTALPLVRERFGACKLANNRLKQRRKVRLNPCRYDRIISLSDAFPNIDLIEEGVDLEAEPTNPPHKSPDSARSKPNSCNIGDGDCCNLASGDCNVVDCGGLDCSGCDCSGLDCGAIDFGTLDCGSLDCGGCDGCAGLDCGGCSW